MSIQTIERTTLTNLIWDEDYARKVIPFIKPEYYADRNERVIFEEITKFTEKYNAIPTQEALTIELDNRKDVNDEEYKKIVDIIVHWKRQMLTRNGYSTPPKSSVKIKQYTMRYLKE